MTQPPCWADRLGDDRKTQPCPRGLPGGVAAVEAIEDERHVALGNAGTLIGHPQPITLELHPDGAARRAPLHRVVQQVGHRALQHVGVADDIERVELDVEQQPMAPAAEPDPTPRSPHCGSPAALVRRRFRRARAATRSPIRAREFHELGLDVSQDVDPILLLQHAARGIGRKKLDVGAQAGERRTQLMTGVSDQPRLPFAGTRPASEASG